jgi:hypothetical protein
MHNTRTLRAALASTALVAPLALAPVAQAQNQGPLLTEEQVASMTAGCQELVRVADTVIGDLDTREQVARLAEADVEADCVVAVEKFQGAQAGIEAAASDEERIQLEAAAYDEAQAEIEAVREVDASATLEIEREAIVEGEVVVRQGGAEVDVQEQGAEVAVTPAVPEVDVSLQQAEIIVRQQQPTIRLAMPQPTISIEMPAPEIFVRMPEPGVDVAMGQPQVEVRQGEPEVAVSVPEPEVNVDVQARIVDPNEVDPENVLEGDPTALARVETTPDEEAQIDVTRSEPSVTVNDPQGEPQVNIARAGEPSITYESAQPKVEIQGEPQVEFNQVGEPKITFETAEQQQQRRDQEQQQLAAVETETETEADIDLEVEEVELEGELEEVEQEVETAAMEVEAEGAELLTAVDPTLDEGVAAATPVGEILDYDVVNAAGEDLGDAERIVRNNGELFLIVSAGGFLGIGDKEVALPMSRVSIRDEMLVLQGLSEEELEQMPEYDWETEEEIGLTDTVDISRF